VIVLDGGLAADELVHAVAAVVDPLLAGRREDRHPPPLVGLLLTTALGAPHDLDGRAGRGPFG
jgi:hypothetical protein